MEEIELNNLSDFELVHIFECGQCFRWQKEKDESYTGVIKCGVVNVKKEEEKTIITGSFKKEDEEYIREYLDLNNDYSAIKKIIEVNDENMQKAIKYGYGIRILNQDPWEMLISYIISAANNIPRISKTIENISKAYGEKVEWNNKEYYKFPTPEALSRASAQDLRNLNLGFRDKYVYNATQEVYSGKVDLENIEKMSYKEAKKELMKIQGVGEKVADCILLFSMKKSDAFPVDTWIKKVMSELYSESRNVKKISAFAENKFGKYAGIAQQYLFYYMRSNSADLIVK